MAATPIRTINLRMTDEEWGAVTAKAEALGLSRPALVRRLFERAGVLGVPTAATPAPEVQPAFKK